MSLSLVATCAVGLEPFLLEELGRLPALEVEAQKGAVAFRGDWPLVWQANLCLRTANRVLLELGSFPAGDGEALARGAQELVESEIRWSGLSARELFDPALTLVVRATTSHSAITDPRWAALKAKDGVVDGQRRRFGQPANQVGIKGGIGAVGKKRPVLPSERDANRRGRDVVVGKASLDAQRSDVRHGRKIDDIV